MALILRPSAAERWGPCAFSLTAEAKYPEEEGEEAREGTAAHFVASEAVQGRQVPAGGVAPNGYVIDEEMVRHAALFLAVVEGVRAQASAQRTEGTEKPLTMHDHIHTSCEGTPDWFLLDYGSRVVHVVDYKYGHRPHDPFRHLQLCAYFAGVVEGSGLTKGDVGANWRVSLTIVQPRSYVPEGPVRNWTAPAPEVWSVVSGLCASAIRATGPNPPAVTGEHCWDCAAQHDCRANQVMAATAMDYAGRSALGNLGPDTQGAELSRLRWAIKRLTAREAAMSTQVEAHIRSGRSVAGWALSNVPGARKWSRPQEEVEAMGDMMGVDLRKLGLKTPAQAIDAGIDEAVIQAYSDRTTGTKLAPVDPKAVAKAFAPKQ